MIKATLPTFSQQALELLKSVTIGNTGTVDLHHERGHMNVSIFKDTDRPALATQFYSSQTSGLDPVYKSRVKDKRSLVRYPSEDGRTSECLLSRGPKSKPKSLSSVTQRLRIHTNTKTSIQNSLAPDSLFPPPKENDNHQIQMQRNSLFPHPLPLL